MCGSSFYVTRIIKLFEGLSILLRGGLEVTPYIFIRTFLTKDFEFKHSVTKCADNKSLRITALIRLFK